MNYVGTAVATILFTLLFLVIYKFLINPQVVLPADLKSMSQCPDMWTFNMKTHMCEPNYKTECLPFDPQAPTLNTVLAKCNVARSCGTTWGGVCP
jgi:hypothetical protein